MKLIIALIYVISFSAYAQFDIGSAISLEHMQFNDDNNSSNNDAQTNIRYKLDVEYEFEESSINASLIARAGLTNNNNYIFIEEAKYKKEFDTTSLLIGFQIFNWANLEFLSVLDNINPKNLDAPLLSVERQGIPAVTFRKEFDESLLDFIWIISTQYSILPHEESRIGPGRKLGNSQSLLRDEGDSEEKQEFQYIIRYKTTLDEFEVDMHFARLVDTSDPMAVAEYEGNVSPLPEDIVIRPYYLPKYQYAIGTTGTVGAFVVKAEAIYIDYEDYNKQTLTIGQLTTTTLQDHGRVSVGLEYSFENGQQSTMTFLEYTTVTGATFEEAKQLGAFQRDIFIGARHSFNDFRSNVLSFGYVFDLQEYQEHIIALNHEIKITQNTKLSTALIIFDTPELEGNNSQQDLYGIKPLRESDNIQMNYSYYF